MFEEVRHRCLKKGDRCLKQKNVGDISHQIQWLHLKMFIDL